MTKCDPNCFVICHCQCLKSEAPVVWVSFTILLVPLVASMLHSSMLGIRRHLSSHWKYRPDEVTQRQAPSEYEAT